MIPFFNRRIVQANFVWLTHKVRLQTGHRRPSHRHVNVNRSFELVEWIFKGKRASRKYYSTAKMRRERLAKISDLIFMGGGRASPRLLNPLPTFTGPISNEVEVSIRLPRSVVAKEQKEKKKKKNTRVRVPLALRGNINREGRTRRKGAEARQLAAGRAMEWRSSESELKKNRRTRWVKNGWRRKGQMAGARPLDGFKTVE